MGVRITVGSLKSHLGLTVSWNKVVIPSQKYKHTKDCIHITYMEHCGTIKIFFMLTLSPIFYIRRYVTQYQSKWIIILLLTFYLSTYLLINTLLTKYFTITIVKKQKHLQLF